MTATLTIDEAGRIELPDALRRVFAAQPGTRLRAEVTADRIQILRDDPELDEVPEITELVTVNGRLMLPRMGGVTDAAVAIRAERDALAERAMPR